MLVSLELRIVRRINGLQFRGVGRLFSRIAPLNHGVMFVLLFATTSVAFDYREAENHLLVHTIAEISYPFIKTVDCQPA